MSRSYADDYLWPKARCFHVWVCIKCGTLNCSGIGNWETHKDNRGIPNKDDIFYCVPCGDLHRHRLATPTETATYRLLKGRTYGYLNQSENYSELYQG